MKRGRKPVVKDPYKTSITIERWQHEALEKEGIELSLFVRDSISSYLGHKRTPREQLILELEENKKEVEEIKNEIARKETRLKELEEEEAIKVKEQNEKEELLKRRAEYFEKNCRSLIRHKELCDIDFYSKAKLVCKFESPDEMLEFFVKSYEAINDNGKTYSKEKIRTFLRLDTEKLKQII